MTSLWGRITDRDDFISESAQDNNGGKNTPHSKRSQVENTGAWYPSPSCRLLHHVLMYSWRSNTLSLRKKLTSLTADLEWCHVLFSRDSYTFIRRIIWPGKDSMELIFNTKFHFESTWNRDWATSHHNGLSVPCRGHWETNQCLVKVFWNKSDYWQLALVSWGNFNVNETCILINNSKRFGGLTMIISSNH